MKVAFFMSGVKVASTTLSAHLIAVELRKLGYQVKEISNNYEKARVINNCSYDVIIFQKKFMPYHGYSDTKKLPKKVIKIYLEDDFEGLESAYHRQTLNHADLVMVGNKAHKKKLQSMIKTPIETYTAILDWKNYSYREPEPIKDKVTITWQQSLADAYVKDLLCLKNVWQKLNQSYPLELNLYGWHSTDCYYGIHGLQGQVKSHLPFAKFHEFCPYDEYVKSIVPEIAQSHIAVIPYTSISHRIGKSGFALKRTMCLGVPVVASPIGGHKALIKDGYNGFLAKDAKEWYKKITELIENPSLRQQFSKESRHLMEKNFSEKACINVFVTAIRKHFAYF